jgi:hypothetical protein
MANAIAVLFKAGRRRQPFPVEARVIVPKRRFIIPPFCHLPVLLKIIAGGA